MASQCVVAAEEAFPNEACGLLVIAPGQLNAVLHVLPSAAAPHRVRAHPDVVVRFAYTAEQQGWRVLATFHTHPGGQPCFSAEDAMLADWADVHVLCYRKDEQWSFTFVRSNVNFG